MLMLIACMVDGSCFLVARKVGQRYTPKSLLLLLLLLLLSNMMLLFWKPGLVFIS
jgi:hypothetical protein